MQILFIKNYKDVLLNSVIEKNIKKSFYKTPENFSSRSSDIRSENLNSESESVNKLTKAESEKIEKELKENDKKRVKILLERIDSDIKELKALKILRNDESVVEKIELLEKLESEINLEDVKRQKAIEEIIKTDKGFFNYNKSEQDFILKNYFEKNNNTEPEIENKLENADEKDKVKVVNELKNERNVVIDNLKQISEIKQKEDSKYLDITEGIMNNREFKDTIGKMIYSNQKDFFSKNTNEQLELIKKELDLKIENEDVLDLGYNTLEISNKILDYLKKDYKENDFIEIEDKEKKELNKNTIEITTDELAESSKPFDDNFKINGIDNDLQEYVTAKNKIEYLSQNIFEIGKNILSMDRNGLGKIARSTFFNTTKKIGYDIVSYENRSVEEHAENMKLFLLKKAFPKNNISFDELEEKIYQNNNDKKIEKIKKQYIDICKKIEEYKKLKEEKKKSEDIINDLELDDYNKKELEEAGDVIESTTNDDLVNNINKQNVNLILSILEKRKFDKEKLERLYKNYGTIAKALTLGSFAIISSTVAIPAIAVGVATATTFTGAYFGGKTGWKNIREGSGFLNKIHGEKIIRNGNRLAFDTEEFRNSNIIELQNKLLERIEITNKINKESKIAGVITGSVAISVGMIIKGILGFSNNEDITNNVNNKDLIINDNIHDNWENYITTEVMANPSTNPELFVELNDYKNNVDEFYSAITNYYGEESGLEVAHALIGGKNVKGLLSDNLKDYIYTDSDGKEFIDLEKIRIYTENNKDEFMSIYSNAKNHPEWFNVVKSEDSIKENIEVIKENIQVNNNASETIKEVIKDKSIEIEKPFVSNPVDVVDDSIKEVVLSQKIVDFNNKFSESSWSNIKLKDVLDLGNTSGDQIKNMPFFQNLPKIMNDKGINGDIKITNLMCLKSQNKIMIEYDVNGIKNSINLAGNKYSIENNNFLESFNEYIDSVVDAQKYKQ